VIDPNNPTQTESLAAQYVELRKSGAAPHPQSPAGAALLSAYNRWKDTQARKDLGATGVATLNVKPSRDDVDKARRKAAKKAAKRLRAARLAVAAAGPNLEPRAMRKAEAAMKYAIERGVPGNPGQIGYAAYVRAGGQSSRAVFGRRVQGRT
jgi:hypothetical protein